MTHSSILRVAGAFAGAALLLSTSGATIAAPMSIAGRDAITPPSVINDIRYRGRVSRRSGAAVPGAVLGLFGAALGAAIANNRYDNYSHYSYGPPNGYAPGYGGGPPYGYGRPGWGG